MTEDDILELALEAEFGYLRFAELLEAKVRAVENEKLLAALKKLKDESHTIQGASDDYKQGREMGIQLCINELIRGEK